MNYVSVCSGIEAATMAWHDMGWKPLAFSEIEKFPSAVLAHHYPEVTNEGDFTTIGDKYDLSDGLIVGGTPCQDFSVAGLRAGLDGERGNLSTEFIKLAYSANAKWLLWENVPGVLSSGSGQDFATILSGFTGCKIERPEDGWKNSGIISGADGCYSVAWRVLDAQYFGVAQRRRRVFIVGYAGGWQRPAAVLFERASLQGHPAPSRKKGEGTAEDAGMCFEPRSPDGEPRIYEQITPTLNTMGGGQREPCVCLQGSMVGRKDENSPQGDGLNEDVSFTLNATDKHAVAIGWDEELNAREELQGALLRGGQGGRHDGVMTTDSQVRRLTPIECERLQGFPDGFTQIPWRNKDIDNCPDGPRYKALGNSMAVPVMKWIGERIEQVNAS